MLPCQKDKFGLPPGEHYLNCAYMSPMAKSVEAQGLVALQAKRMPAAISSADFFTVGRQVRALFNELIGGQDPKRVALLPSVSYGIATAAKNLLIEKGQTIVVLHEQFPSNVYTWQRLAAETGAEVVTVARDDAQPHLWNQRLLGAIDKRTAVVALPHIHWTDGTRFALREISQRTRALGAALIVDATQSLGALPFDLVEIPVDALICAGYKWLLGPYSTALGYFGERFDRGAPIEESWINRQGSEDFRGLVNYQDKYTEGAGRYNAGGSSNLNLLPMLAESLRLVLAWRPENIQDYCRQLTAPLVQAAQELGYVLAQEPARAAHMFGLGLPPGVARAALAGALSARKIHVSFRGDVIRIAPHLYNDAADIDALVGVLRQLNH